VVLVIGEGGGEGGLTREVLSAGRVCPIDDRSYDLICVSIFSSEKSLSWASRDNRMIGILALTPIPSPYMGVHYT